MRYDVSFDPAADRWYLDASWRAASAPVPRLHELRNRPVVGVDLNAGHMAACVLDRSGSPVGEAVSIEVVTAGLAASHRDGLTRAAITKLHDYAHQHDCAAIVIENLDFAAARAAGRGTLGSGQHGKRLRRCLADIRTARFRNRLIGMATRRGIAVIGVDPAYTSRWGNQHWRKPLQQQTSDPSTVTGHHGAAAAIG